MENEFSNLNGFNNLQLPDILPGTANELIAVNNDATDYILIPSENIIPEPITYKQILNSTAGGVWDWSTDPKAVSFTADGGASNGYKFDGTTSSFITEFNTTKIINNGVERLLCTSNGVDLKGAVSVDNLITVPTSSTFGIGNTSSNKVEFGATNISLRANGTIRLQATGTGVTLVGNITQNVGANTNTLSGTVSVDNSLTATTLKASSAGTSVLAAVRVVNDNTGLYQSTANQLDIIANGTRLLNFSDTRAQTVNNFEFNRCYSLGNNVIVTSGSASISTTGVPLYIAKGHATLNQDLDFNAASSYFSGQTYNIITVDTGATQLIRYRAQSTTTHIQNGTITTITANTYHTLEKNRMYIVFCNVDSNTFYLIRI